MSEEDKKQDADVSADASLETSKEDENEDTVDGGSADSEPEAEDAESEPEAETEGDDADDAEDDGGDAPEDADDADADKSDEEDVEADESEDADDADKSDEDGIGVERTHTKRSDRKKQRGKGDSAAKRPSRAAKAGKPQKKQRGGKKTKGKQDRRFQPKKRPSKIRNHVVLLILLAVLLVGSVILFVPPGEKIKQGLDVQGGLSVVMQASTTDGSAITSDQMSSARSIVENRVNALGASEASVQLQGTDQLLVQIPGIVDQTQALETIGQTGVLTFVNVADITDTTVRNAIEQQNSSAATTSGSTPTSTIVTDQDINEGLAFGSIKESQFQGFTDTNGHVPQGEYLRTASTASNSSSSSGSSTTYTYSQLKLASGTYTPIFSGSDITNVTVGKESQGSQYYAVNITLDSQAASAFGTVTTQLAPTKGQIAILLDGVVQSAPAVQSAITDGNVAITGNYTINDANSLKTILQSGSLPVSLSVINSQVVGPTLGQQSLFAGILVALIGLILVALYLLAFYRGLGILTAGAIAVFATLYLGILALLSAFNLFALSLAGIAGIVLSIGVAADSSILVLERFKEEIRMGRSVRAASITGVKHAIITSIDADLVTLISALALFIIAVGSVKGFGLTLALGVVCDVLTMILFKAPLVRLLAPRSIAHHPGFWGVREDEELALASGELDRSLAVTREADEEASRNNKKTKKKDKKKAKDMLADETSNDKVDDFFKSDKSDKSDKDDKDDKTVESKNDDGNDKTVSDDDGEED